GVGDGYGKVSYDVQYVASSDGVARHHGDDRFGQPPDLDLQVEDVQPADPCLVDVAVVTPNPLVATGAEGLGPCAGEDDHPDRGVVTGSVEGVRHLDDSPRPEGVAELGPVDGDLRDTARDRCRIDDVGVVSRTFPIHE